MRKKVGNVMWGVVLFLLAMIMIIVLSMTAALLNSGYEIPIVSEVENPVESMRLIMIAFIGMVFVLAVPATILSGNQ